MILEEDMPVVVKCPRQLTPVSYRTARRVSTYKTKARECAVKLGDIPVTLKVGEIMADGQ